MKSRTIFALSGLASAGQSSAQGGVEGVVSLSFERNTQTLRGRSDDGTVEVPRGYQNLSYVVNATVGTPPQSVFLTLDTGSSDIVLLTSESSWCKKSLQCPSPSYYNANDSSSYTYLNSNFSATYGDPAPQGKGTFVSGDVVTDVFSIGGISIKDQLFDVSYGDETIGFSLLGLSYAGGENQVNYFNAPKYNNLPLSMEANGIINLAQFTLWLDSASGKSGKLLFGGIDEAKYSGELITLPVQNRTGFHAPVMFDILMNGFALNANGTNPTIGFTGSNLTLVDCGTWYSRLPDNWITPIFDKLEVSYFPLNDIALVNCDLANKDYTFDFTFNGLSIQAPISNFVTPREVFESENYCIFNILPAGDRQALLGANFLASAVAVFDLSNDQVSFGQRDFTSSEKNVVAVPKGGVLAMKGVLSGT